MRGEDLQRWIARNVRENTGYALKTGDRIKDQQQRSGRVTEVRVWEGEPSVENHGTIYVVRDDGSEDQYAWFGWEEKFRIKRA